MQPSWVRWDRATRLCLLNAGLKLAERATAASFRSVPLRRAWVLACLAGACAALDVALIALDSHAPVGLEVGAVIYLGLAAILLSVPRIQLPRGYLTLGAIAMNSAGLILTPRYAAVVGVAAGLAGTVLHRRVVSVRVIQVITVATGPICASAAHLHTGFLDNRWVSEGIALTVATATPLVLTGLVGSLLGSEPLVMILRRNLSRHWVGAFMYFAIASALIAHVLNGTAEGYVLASFVAVLALALSDSVAGRQLRMRLQAQVNDAERVIAYTRVVEGTIHNLRNHLAAASGHLDEVAAPALSATDARHVLVATAAVMDAVELLDQLQAGNVVLRESSLLDLAAVTRDAALLLKSRADKKTVDLILALPEIKLTVRSDPLLIKQVVSNLVLNAIDAVGRGGRVTVSIEHERSLAIVKVADDGPGVPAKYRARLFEPHFTTKPHGNGIGLYVSYRIARQLGGDLRYDGASSGAVFTFALPASG